MKSDDVNNPSYQCYYTEEAFITRIVNRCIKNISMRKDVTKYRSIASSISQCLIKSAFRDVSFGGDKHGIYGATPFETLHTLVGCIKHCLHSLFSCRIARDGHGEGLLRASMDRASRNGFGFVHEP